MATENTEDFDIHDPAFAADPYPTYERLRRECPVVHGEKHGGYWLLTRYEDVRQATRDWKTFTSGVPGVTSIPVATRRTEPQLPLELDPPLHSRYRALVNPVFSPARIEALRPRVEAIASQLVDAILDRSPHGSAGSSDCTGLADLVRDYCVPLSVETLAEFTGLPRDDAPKWVDWAKRLFDVNNREDGVRATHELNTYIDGLIAVRRRMPRPDLVGILLESEVDGHHLTDQEIRAFCQLQFLAGFETTWDAMSVTLLYLLGDPDGPEIRRRLAADPTLIPAAVEEFLRYVTPIQIFGRNATHDLALHGHAIPKGDVVAVSFASANHDPTVFPDPQRCLLDRFQSRRSNASILGSAGSPSGVAGSGGQDAAPGRHLTFGAGVHLCLGAPVARLELAITLREFTTRAAHLRLDTQHPPLWKTRGDRRGLSSLPVLV